MLPCNPLAYDLSEFSDEELASALLTHKVDKSNVPYWLWQKLKWPGVLRLCEIIQAEHSTILKNMPEMTLAEISFMFIKERLDDFAKLHPGGRQLSREGVEEVLNKILELFSEQGYRSLPFSKLKTVNDFHPHDLAQNSWNILLRQGFLIRGQDANYELGNDWGVILIGKYLIDTCMRPDVSQAEQALLIDRIFDSIAPLSPEGRISVDDSNRLEDVLWFALHYAKTQRISESVFCTLMDNLFAGQNLHRDSMSEIAARLFPEYSIRYIATLSDDTKALYMREGLQRAPSSIVVPEAIKAFLNASDDIKLQFAILLEHHKDSCYLNDIYSLIDENLLPSDEQKRIHITQKLYHYLYEFPDECCLLIQLRLESGRINHIDSAVHLVGFNGTLRQSDLLRALINLLPDITPNSLRDMGQLRMMEAEAIAMDALMREDELDLQVAAIDALGHLQSERFLNWCKTQNNLWEKKYYFRIIDSLQAIRSTEAYDYMIYLEFQKKSGVPFTYFNDQYLLKYLNKNQFTEMITGMVNKLERSGSIDEIWRGLNNISSLNNGRLNEWWAEYRGTKAPGVIADLARRCARPEYFSSRSRTTGSSAMDEALKVLDLIGDKTILVSLLLDLMKKKIPELFAFALVPVVIKYIDPCYKGVLISIATGIPSTEVKDDSIRDIIEQKAITCLTHLSGDDVFDVILEKRGNRHSDDVHDLFHFKTNYAIQRIVEVLRTQDESKFGSAYLFLWDFLPEETIDHCLHWLRSVNRDDWKYKYLLRFLLKFDKPELNENLMGFLRDPAAFSEIIDVLSISTDQHIHVWFKEQIALYSSAKIVFSEKQLHKGFLAWIRNTAYKDCREYLQQFVVADQRDWLLAPSLVSLAYRIIGEFEFWEFLELIKSKYYRWNPHWSTSIIKATLILIHHREPEWTWKEFLEFWDSASDFRRKEAITWVSFMLSKTSVAWLLNLYPNVGGSFRDEKEIRNTIRRTCGKLAGDLREYGIDILSQKALSSITKDRIKAAICSGLFGEDVYNKFNFLSNDECVRVRELYQCAAIADACKE